MMEKAVISGVAFSRDEAKITLTRVPDRPGIAYQILGAIADANIDVDMIVQNISVEGTTDFSFTVHRNEYQKALEVLNSKVKDHVGAKQIVGDPKIAKVSVVGIGMRSHVGIASLMFRTLVRGGDQHPDDLDQRDQDLGRGRGQVHGTRGARAAQGLRTGAGAGLNVAARRGSD